MKLRLPWRGIRPGNVSHCSMLTIGIGISPHRGCSLQTGWWNFWHNGCRHRQTWNTHVAQWLSDQLRQHARRRLIVRVLLDSTATTTHFALDYRLLWSGIIYRSSRTVIVPKCVNVDNFNPGNGLRDTCHRRIRTLHIIGYYQVSLVVQTRSFSFNTARASLASLLLSSFVIAEDEVELVHLEVELSKN